MPRVSLQTGTSSVTSDLDFASTRLLTDSALENITEWRQFSGEDMFRSKLRLQIRIDDFRKAQGGLTNTDIFITNKIDRYQLYVVFFPPIFKGICQRYLFLISMLAKYLN